MTHEKWEGNHPTRYGRAVSHLSPSLSLSSPCLALIIPAKVAVIQPFFPSLLLHSYKHDNLSSSGSFVAFLLSLDCATAGKM